MQFTHVSEITEIYAGMSNFSDRKHCIKF